MPSIPTVTAAASPPPAPRPARPVPRWRLALRIVLGTLVGVWSLLLLAWLTLHWGILNHIERWRPDIEARASELLGVSVRIGHIETTSGGWIPAITLRDVVLRDGSGHEVLRLPHVAAALSPESLVALRPRLAQLLIEGAALEVRRDAAGAVTVAGIPLRDAPGSGDTAATDWLLEQPELVLRGGSVRWIDERRGAPPLELSDLQFVVRHHHRRHELRLDATPPPEWGERLTVQGRFERPLLSRAGAIERWSGELQASLPRVDLGRLGRHADLPVDLPSGHGALRAWLDWRTGEPQRLTVDLALREVVARFGPALEPLVLQSVQGRLVAAREGDRLRIDAQRFGFVSASGVEWPAGDLSLAWRSPAAPDRAALVEDGTLAAGRLDLDLLSQLARHLPLAASQQRALAALAPRGVVSGLQARWDGPLSAPAGYQVQARIEGLSLAAGAPAAPDRPGRPGVRNATLQLEASERGGSARVTLRDGQLSLPGLLVAPEVPLTGFSGQLAWSIEAPPPAGGRRPTVEVRLREGRFSNADARGRLEATWRSSRAPGGPFPGRLELDASVDSLPVARLPDYLPLRLDAGLREYLAGAFREGRLDDTRVRLRGDLARFPFGPGAEGELRVSSRLSAATLDIAPAAPGTRGAWPRFESLAGELVFEQRSMRIVDASATVLGVQLTGVHGGIAHLSRDAVLELDGRGDGPADGLLGFVRQSPVGRWTDGVLDQARASGGAALQLALSLPLNETGDSRVRGEIRLQDSDLQLHPQHPALQSVTGRLRFSEREFSIVDTRAQILGGPLRLAGGSQPGGGVRLEGEGEASAAGLRQAAPDVLPRLAAQLAGQAAYRFGLDLGRGPPALQLSSDLSGLAIDLPAPLGKPAGSALPLQLTLRPEPSAPGDPARRDALEVQLGGLLQARYRREHRDDGAVRVLAGGLALQAPLRVPARGVHAALAVDHVDVDAWRALLDGGQPVDVVGAEVAAAAVAAAGPRSEYLPHTVSLQAGTLAVGGHEVHRLTAALSDEDGLWRAQIDADELRGRVDFLPPGSGGADGLLRARLDRLVLRPAAASAVKLAPEGDRPASAAAPAARPTPPPSTPGRVPALDIVVEDLQRNGRHLGRLEVLAVHRPQNPPAAPDSAPDWQLDRLRLTNAEARLEAQGHWRQTPDAPRAPRRSVMDFTLEVRDSGALLERFGHAGMVSGGRGQLSGQLAWLGSPLWPDLASLQGGLRLSLDEGRFLRAEPGAARLLGVLSLQALPRRLLLDFRDVFGEGFAFDRFEGDVQVDAGIARTRNLRMRGVQAAVLLEGETSLTRETQDLRVVVVPEINAGTASLAYAIINPMVGLGTFFAQWLMRKPMSAASTREFHVHGSWADPRVDRVESATAAPEPPEPAASAAQASDTDRPVAQ